MVDEAHYGAGGRHTQVLSNLEAKDVVLQSRKSVHVRVVHRIRHVASLRALSTHDVLEVSFDGMSGLFEAGMSVCVDDCWVCFGLFGVE